MVEEDIGFGFTMLYLPGMITGQFNVWKTYYGHKFGGMIKVSPEFYEQKKEWLVSDTKNRINIKLNRFDRKWWKSAH